MPHYNAYDSFKTKKSIEKKRRAKEKALGKKWNNIKRSKYKVKSI